MGTLSASVSPLLVISALRPTVSAAVNAIELLMTLKSTPVFNNQVNESLFNDPPLNSST